ncbi:Transposase [Lactococcus cremoris]|nr:Transposase [Lactococcus cremoris]
MLRIGSYILLFYLAFRLSKHSFEFEKVSRLEKEERDILKKVLTIFAEKKK